MIFIVSTLCLRAMGPMRSHDLGPSWIPTIRKDQGVSQRLRVGPPFRFCAAPSAFVHNGDPIGLHNFVNSERCFELADAPLETRHAIIRSR
jgi:hypothetical protein